MKKRLDLATHERGLARSRSHARVLVEAGQVRVNGAVVLRPATLVHEEDELDLCGARGYVSRGGYKLAGALRALEVEATGKVCADVGASTGGFTDCLLRHGARRVYSVDVGTGQLDASLRADARVVSMEGLNARALEPSSFDEAPELVVVDASFISLGKLSDALARILPASGELIALVKPQFEVGAREARRARGVVRDPAERQRAIAAARAGLEGRGFRVIGGCESPLPGPRGNLEHFLHAVRSRRDTPAWEG